MIDLTLTRYYAPLLVMLIVFIFSYILLKKASIPGSDWVLAFLSLLIAFLFASSTRTTSYLINLLPLLTIIFTISLFFVLITAMFVTKDFDPFKKIVAWLSFIVAILIVLTLAFNQFPTLNHMLPSSSNSGLDSNLREFKDLIYSQEFKDGLIFVVSIVVVGFLMLKKK